MDIKEIKEYIKQKKYTYAHIAELSGLSLGTIKEVFSGRTKNPRLDTMNAICDALGLPLELPTQPTILQFNTIYRNTFIAFDSSGDKHVFNFDKENFDAILKICDNLSKKN